MSDNMQAVESVLPCPFCGNTSNDIESRSHDDPARDQAHVFCLICEAYGPITRTEPEAIAAWNRRAATADARAGEVAAWMRVDGKDVLTSAGKAEIVSRKTSGQMVERFSAESTEKMYTIPLYLSPPPPRPDR